MSTDDKITWLGKDLSANGVAMLYRGNLHVRPIGRGTMLTGLESEPGLEEVLDAGDYEVEIRVIRRIVAAGDGEA